MKVLNETAIRLYSITYKFLFQCHRYNQLAHCEQYLAGLFHECKSNIERMSERVPNSDAQNLNHFISNAPWEALAVMAHTAGLVSERLGKLGKPVGLIFDESGWEKNGVHSVGVGHQYIGNVGKRCNSQNGVFAALTSDSYVGLIGGRLYLPDAWTSDEKRCLKAGIPKASIVYKTKPELAIEIHESVGGKVKYDWVGGDSIYGNSPTLRHYLAGAGETFVLDVGEGLGVYLNDPQPAVPPRTSKRGATPTQFTTTEKKVLLKDLIHQISADQWRVIGHRNGTKGSLLRKAALIDVYVWDTAYQDKVERLQLIISTDKDGSEVKFSVCYQKNGKMTREDALFRQMQRYFVERGFQNAKEQLGMHQYQTRSWTAWHHHIALSLMALDFLLAQQLDLNSEYPLISCTDVKILIARSLSNNFNTYENLITAMKKRHKQRQYDITYNKT